MSLFGSFGYSSDDYIAINFASAANAIQDEILKNDKITSQHIEPKKINISI